MLQRSCGAYLACDAAFKTKVSLAFYGEEQPKILKSLPVIQSHCFAFGCVTFVWPSNCFFLKTHL